jgi:hypothetical protein
MVTHGGIEMNEETMRQQKKTIKGYVARRSFRALVRIPVLITGKDEQGVEFKEETETCEVSKYGARIYLLQELKEDTILKLCLKESKVWMDVRVVWLGSEENNTKGHVGIEFVETSNFFGVVFPEEDW